MWANSGGAQARDLYEEDNPLFQEVLNNIKDKGFLDNFPLLGIEVKVNEERRVVVFDGKPAIW